MIPDNIIFINTFRMFEAKFKEIVASFDGMENFSKA